MPFPANSVAEAWIEVENEVIGCDELPKQRKNLIDLMKIIFYMGATAGTTLKEKGIDSKLEILNFFNSDKVE